MTREKQIKKANPYRGWNHTPDNCDGCKEAHYHDGFKEGAEWADTHPNWHKYPDDKPKKNGKYYVAYYDGGCETDNYIDGAWCGSDSDDVKGWKELPQPPKFD